MKKILVTMLIIVAASTLVSAQKKYYTQSLYWLRYQNTLNFSKKLFWVNEADNRRFFNPDIQNQFIAHSHLHRRFKNGDYAVGLTYSVSYAAVPENGPKPGRDEIRPFIEGNYDFPFKKFTLQNRLRIDERFFQENLDESVFKESFSVTRFRYRLQLRVPIVKTEDGATKIGFRLADEIMFNSKENTYDQNRVYILGDFMVHKNVTLEAGYIYIDQHAYGREEYYARNVLRFSVLHRINLQKSS